MTENAQPDAAASAEVKYTAALDRTLDLLKARDDTSKFVGLALLKSLLDNEEKLRKDSEVVSKCWAAVSARFLDRLLHGSESKSKTSEEVRSMVDLAVSVIHTFTLLMSSSTTTTSVEDEKLIGRTDGLLHALTQSSSEAKTQILKTLLSFAGGPHGARALLMAEDLSRLFEIASSQALAYEVSKYALLNAAARPELHDLLQIRFDGVISGLMTRSENSNVLPLLNFLIDLLPKLPPNFLKPDPPWLRPVATLIRRGVITHSSPTVQRATRLLSSYLLQAFPSAFPPLLFDSTPASKASDGKPFLYLFINLASIDLRASFSSLIELLVSADYPSISQGLVADFNILSAFTGYLAHSLNEEDEGAEISLVLPPDLLLKLRRDLGETTSLTIEFLRDRWDGAVAGAAGLHPSERPKPDMPARTAGPLSLTWDNKDGGVVKDPLILAAIQYLALWLREDDNEALRTEAAGVVDVLLGLYDFCQRNQEEPDPQEAQDIDFRPPVLVALEGILATNDGILAFLREDGWAVLSKDLLAIIPRTSPVEQADELRRAIEIVRVLFTVVEHESTNGTREAWMALLKTAIPHFPELRRDQSATMLELRVSLYQLATALLAHAPPRLRSGFAAEAGVIADVCRALLKLSHGASEKRDSLESAQEVLDWLGELGMNGRGGG